MSAVGEWVWQIAIRKGVSRAVQLLVAWLTAHVLAHLASIGIKVELNVDALTVSALAVLEVLRNWLKVKQGIKWL